MQSAVICEALQTPHELSVDTYEGSAKSPWRICEVSWCLSHFLVNAIITNHQVSSLLWLQLASWDWLVFFVASIYGDGLVASLPFCSTFRMARLLSDYDWWLGILGLLSDYGWRIGSCWVSSSAFARVHTLFYKIDKLLCVSCVDHTLWLIHRQSMDVPRTW